MTAKRPESYCLNCETTFVEDGRHPTAYCHVCGQARKTNDLSFRRLVGDTIANLFNLDNRIFRTLRNIISPHLLSDTFVSGRRQYYVHPVRLFLVTLLATFALVFLSIDKSEIHFGEKSIQEEAYDTYQLERYHLLTDTLDDQTNIDLIRKSLFDGISPRSKDTLSQKGKIALFDFHELTQAYGISTYDAVHLTRDQIFQKYKVEGFWNQLKVGQYLRVATDPAGMAIFALRNVTWAVILTVLLLSLFIYLMYWRGGYYLAEHTIVLLNFHSFTHVLAIAMIIVMWCISFLLPDAEDYMLYIFAIYCIFLYVVGYTTYKKYYRQGHMKTTLKFGVIGLAYFMVFSICTVLVAILSVFLYR